MKKILTFCVLASFIATFSFGQEQVKQTKEEFKKEIQSNYSNWYVSFYGGVPFTNGGDMVTFSEKKTYIGYMGGLQLGYQISPLFGLSLTGQYGKGNAGAKGVEVNYLLDPSGKTNYDIVNAKNPVKFQDLYSEIKHFTTGLHFDFNLAALMNKSKNRKVALVLSPAVYLQKFSPVVNRISNDSRYTTADLDNKAGLGLGGDLDFRYNISKHIDLLVKGGLSWVLNNNFDGVDNTGTDLKYGTFGHLGAGLVWKMGNADKKDNIIYAPTEREVEMIWAEKQAQEELRSKLEAKKIEKKEEAKKEEAKKEEAKKEEVKKQEVVKPTPPSASAVEVRKEKAFSALPTIHFVRNSYKVDEIKYAQELATIVATLKEFPEVKVDLVGYCDHLGTDAYNKILSVKRAGAMKRYLATQGIEADRLNIIGGGKDPSLTGKDALSVKARRVVVTK